MNLKEFSGYCFDEIGAKKGYTRYRNSWYKLENEILLGFGMVSQRCHGYGIEFEIVPLSCGIWIYNTGEMRFQPGGAHFRHTHERIDCCTLNFKDKDYCDEAKEYVHHLFERSIEPFLDGVHDLASGFDMIQAYERYNAEGALGNYDPDILQEDSDWFYLCALKRYDDALLNAERCLEKWGVTELDDRYPGWKLYAPLRNKDYAAIEAILEENKQKSLALLKKHRIFR